MNAKCGEERPPHTTERNNMNDITIIPERLTGELESLANSLQHNYCDVLALAYGVTTQDGLVGLTYYEDTKKIFDLNSKFILSDVHDEGVSYDTIDDYVWHMVGKHAYSILGHWAATAYIVPCAVCESYEYAKHALTHNESTIVCSKSCLAKIESKEEES